MKTTKEIAVKTIERTAKAYGFETGSGFWGVPSIRSEDVNFTFWLEDTADTNWEEHRVGRAFKVKASIGRMGGEPTTEELLKTADEIRRAANLVDYLNSLELEWVETF